MSFFRTLTIVGVILCNLLYCIPCRAGHELFPASARSRSLGVTGVVLESCWSGFQNPAGLAGLNHLLIALQYENHFMVPELGQGAFAFCLPVHSGTLALNYSYFGYSGYNENLATLSYGISFGEHLRAGIGLNYILVRQAANYGNMHAAIPSAGFQLTPANNLILGLCLYNPLEQGFSNISGERIPARLQVGAGYHLEDEVLICFEMIRQRGAGPVYAGGLEFTVSEILDVRMGLLFSEYIQVSFGIGVKNRSLVIDLSASRHPVLGYSPSLSLQWNL